MRKLSLTVRRGAKADIPIRIESDLLVFVAITSMSRSAPLLVTAPMHGMPNGWRAAIMNAGGMTELNTPWNHLRAADLRKIALVDANSFQVPDVNSASWRTYTNGGQVVYYQPIDLSAYSAASLDVRESVGATLLANYSTGTGTLELDNANSALWLRLSDAQSSALEAGTFVFDIEITRVAGGTTALCAPDSELLVLPEVTTT